MADEFTPGAPAPGGTPTASGLPDWLTVVLAAAATAALVWVAVGGVR
jgi:hypothetical protein